MFDTVTLTKLNDTDETLSRNKRLKAYVELAKDLAKLEVGNLAEPEENRTYQDLVDSGLAWFFHQGLTKNIEIAITKGLVKETFEEETNAAD